MKYGCVCFMKCNAVIIYIISSPYENLRNGAAKGTKLLFVFGFTDGLYKSNMMRNYSILLKQKTYHITVLGVLLNQSYTIVFLMNTYCLLYSNFCSLTWCVVLTETDRCAYRF